MGGIVKEAKMQAIRTETTENYDRHGIYGEAGVTREGKLELLSNGRHCVVRSVLPDHRVIVEYEGTDKVEAETVFSMIAKSRVPGHWA